MSPAIASEYQTVVARRRAQYRISGSEGAIGGCSVAAICADLNLTVPMRDHVSRGCSEGLLLPYVPGGRLLAGTSPTFHSNQPVGLEADQITVTYGEREASAGPKSTGKPPGVILTLEAPKLSSNAPIVVRSGRLVVTEGAGPRMEFEDPAGVETSWRGEGESGASLEGTVDIETDKGFDLSGPMTFESLNETMAIAPFLSAEAVGFEKLMIGPGPEVDLEEKPLALEVAIAPDEAKPELMVVGSKQKPATVTVQPGGYATVRLNAPGTVSSDLSGDLEFRGLPIEVSPSPEGIPIIAGTVDSDDFPKELETQRQKTTLSAPPGGTLRLRVDAALNIAGFPVENDTQVTLLAGRSPGEIRFVHDAGIRVRWTGRPESQLRLRRPDGRVTVSLASPSRVRQDSLRLRTSAPLRISGTSSESGTVELAYHSPAELSPHTQIIRAVNELANRHVFDSLARVAGTTLEQYAQAALQFIIWGLTFEDVAHRIAALLGAAGQKAPPEKVRESARALFFGMELSRKILQAAQGAGAPTARRKVRSHEDSDLEMFKDHMKALTDVIEAPALGSASAASRAGSPTGQRKVRSHEDADLEMFKAHMKAFADAFSPPLDTPALSNASKDAMREAIKISRSEVGWRFVPAGEVELSPGWLGLAKKWVPPSFADTDMEQAVTERAGGAEAQVQPVGNPMTAKGAAGCFIATAAYGSELAPEVQFLRELRDKVLRKTRWGQRFFEEYWQYYYRFSHGLAQGMQADPNLRRIVGWSIVTPFVNYMKLLIRRPDWSRIDLDKVEPELREFLEFMRSDMEEWLKAIELPYGFAGRDPLEAAAELNVALDYVVRTGGLQYLEDLVARGELPLKHDLDQRSALLAALESAGRTREEMTLILGTASPPC